MFLWRFTIPVLSEAICMMVFCMGKYSCSNRWVSVRQSSTNSLKSFGVVRPSQAILLNGQENRFSSFIMRAFHFMWWSDDHLMMTSLNGNIFRVTGLLCREFTGHQWIPPQRPVTRNFDVYFDMRMRVESHEIAWCQCVSYMLYLNTAEIIQEQEKNNIFSSY